MARVPRTSIRRKLMRMILVTSTAVLLLACGSFIGYEVLIYRREALHQLATLGRIIAAESTGAVAFENPHDATEILSALKAERHIVLACLYDRNGRVFSRYPADAPDAAFPRGPQADGYRFEGDRLVGFSPLVQVEGSGRFGTLYLCSDMGALHERLRLYCAIAAMVIVLASLVAYALSRMLQRAISAPILALAETARAVSERRDYTVRAAQPADDELGALTDAFNHMLAEIQAQNESLERRVRERTAELQLANSELDAFCSSAAHDLRTPLRAITGFSDVLLDPRAQMPATEAQRYVRMIRDGSSQMSTLINDLLEFARLGRRDLARQNVDLTQVCQDVIRELDLHRTAQTAEVHLQPLGFANCDPALLRIVFANLLSNALKYSRPREQPRVDVGVESDPATRRAIYFIRDNGVGFDMRDAGKLFGVFQRLHHAHEFEGTGVGLATVRRIVERHGGRLWADATPDVGATFFFTLGPS